jgi:glycerol transport system ATP-binding protein
VRSDVAAILFDEPLTVIDPHLKWQLRRKLKQIHEQLKLTFIYVTHDQVEALTFADQVAVMYEGQIVQVGTPQELFDTPAHTFVGYFIGSPGMNFLPCTLAGANAVIDGSTVPLAAGVADKARAMTGELELGIRPEFLKLRRDRGDGAVPVAISDVEDLGNFKIVTVRLGGHTLKVKLPEDQEIPGTSGFLTFTPELTKLYADGRLIR